MVVRLVLAEETAETAVIAVNVTVAVVGMDQFAILVTDQVELDVDVSTVILKLVVDFGVASVTLEETKGGHGLIRDIRTNNVFINTNKF